MKRSCRCEDMFAEKKPVFRRVTMTSRLTIYGDHVFRVSIYGDLTGACSMKKVRVKIQVIMKQWIKLELHGFLQLKIAIIPSYRPS